ncbi:sensor histidine kinase [Arthrobacter agilis]|uniref:sensor histidine kinase n=1 Tax=Arthrobacter agilis TaxID=37921 RepID=UPI002781DC14|nr:sensor histidine kinase [Arthrobacter agilis]MDQ0734313.1 two-component system CitB family sensor kinase [Arthrobacter agilis]
MILFIMAAGVTGVTIEFILVTVRAARVDARRARADRNRKEQDRRVRRWSLARQFFLAQLVFILALSASLSVILYVDAAQGVNDAAAERMVAVSTAIALEPAVLDAVEGPDPSTTLQPYAVEVMDRLGVDFITIMATDRTRFTHRNPEQIGRPYLGSVSEALAGRTHTETYAGTLGPSIRSIVPVVDGDGTVRAMVASGITVDRAAIARNAQLPLVALIALGSLALGALASFLLSRRLRHATLGMGPADLSRSFVFYDAVLHSVREGLLLTDAAGRLVLYNDQAARLLGLDGTQDPVPASRLAVPPSLRELLASGRRAHDEVHLTASRVLVVNQEPAVPPAAAGRGAQQAALGTVTTLRDHTDIEALTGQVQTMRTLTDALRSQTHEHANRLHTIVSLVELGRGADAIDFATRDLQQSQRLTDEVVQAVDEPFIAALLVGKAAQANERGIELITEIAPEARAGLLNPVDLVTIIGNLLDNAFDEAVASAEPRVVLTVRRVGDDAAPGLGIVVEDSGNGLPDSEKARVFAFGYSTKAPDAAGGTGRGIGLALVRQAVERFGGSVEVTDTEDGGARFSVRLPLPGAPDGPADHPAGSSGTAAGGTPTGAEAGTGPAVPQGAEGGGRT